MALARIAEAMGDQGSAIRHWRAALAIRPDKQQALIRLGAGLLREGQYEEAEACAARLSACHPDSPHGPILRAQVAQARSGFVVAAPLWAAAAQRFGGNADFLRAYGRALLAAAELDQAEAVAARLRPLDTHQALSLRGEILAKRSPYGDRTDFWKAACAELPRSTDVVRKLLHAALWARRVPEAESAFARLLARKQVNAGDAAYMVGLGHAYLEVGDKAAARCQVRAFLKEVRRQPNGRAAALRLERLILAAFPSRREHALALSRNTARFTRMVHATPLSSGATGALDRIVALEEVSAASGAACLLDTDVDAESCRAFIRVVRQRLSAGTPFSLIRLGDGEANAFAYGASYAASFTEDAAGREKIWWGRTLAADQRTLLAKRVRTAIAGADTLGIPTRARVLRDVRLDTGRPLEATRSGRGLLAVMEAVTNAADAGLLRNKLLTSAHLHQDLERWNLYGELFEGAGDVVLVSCHAGLPEVLQARFGLRVVKHVSMPPGDAMLEMQHRSLTEPEMPPQSLERALEALGDWPRRRLVLVGAGYAGKVIVDEARLRGGVALDLGSIFDRWSGSHTRSYQDLA